MLPEFQPVTGKYEVLRQLSEGGMGAIYLARHRLLDELRVIKVMRTSIQDDPEFRDRFVREARTAIQLRHPNLAQLYEFEADEKGTAFMVLEYIDGRTLEELIAARSIRSLRLKVGIAVQCLRALAFLHRKGFVHRDIAPDNIMLTRDTEGGPLVKLLDLGIVKVVAGDGGHTGTAVFLGKFRYASPEQLESSNIDHRSDLYSFGILLYELLTGVYPIAGNDMRSIMSGHLFRPPIAFADSDPEDEIPPALRELVLSALEKDPKRRPQSAEEFGRRLAAIVLPAEDEGQQVTLPINLDRILGERGSGEHRHRSTQDEIDRRFELDKKTPTPAVYSPSSEAKVDELESLLADTAAKLERGDLDAAETGAQAIADRPGVPAAVAARARHLLTTVRERRCGRLTAEASQALAAGKVGAATEALNRALRLDPEYAEARKLVKEIGRRIERESLEERRERNLAQLRQRVGAALERGDHDLARAWLAEVPLDAVPEAERRALAARVEAAAAAATAASAPTEMRTAPAAVPERPAEVDAVTQESPLVEPSRPVPWTPQRPPSGLRRSWIAGAAVGAAVLALLLILLLRKGAAPAPAPAPDSGSQLAQASPPAADVAPPPAPAAGASETARPAAAPARPAAPPPSAAPANAPAAQGATTAATPSPPPATGVEPPAQPTAAPAAESPAKGAGAARGEEARKNAADLALKARRYFEVGRFAEAAETAEQALALDPANESASRTLASLPTKQAKTPGGAATGDRPRTAPPAATPPQRSAPSAPVAPPAAATAAPAVEPAFAKPGDVPGPATASDARPASPATPAPTVAVGPRRRWSVTGCGLITRLVGGGAVSSLKLAPGTLEAIETRFLAAGAAVDGVTQLRILFTANGLAEPGLHVPNNSAEMRFIREIAPEVHFQPAWVDTKPRDVECTLVRARS